MATPVHHPNLFQFSGEALQISYSTTGIDGKAHFTYQDPNQTLGISGDDPQCRIHEVDYEVEVVYQA
jgi:hypothetical protein